MTIDTLTSFPGAYEPEEIETDDGFLDYLEPETREPFRVDTDSKATWAMRKYAEAQAEVAATIAIAEAEIERIQQWASHAVTGPTATMAYMEAQLSMYALAVRAETDGKRKSISTPYGKVATRAATEKWQIDDEAFIEWAKTNQPDWVETKMVRAIDVPTLRKALAAEEITEGVVAITPEGDIVPGIVIVKGDPTAKVEVSA